LIQICLQAEQQSAAGTTASPGDLVAQLAAQDPQPGM